jgi:ribonuclease BN (tRNA processing enzyme)
MKMNKRSDKLTVYVHEKLKEHFLKFLEINYIFKLRLGFELEIISFKTNAFCAVSRECGFTARENTHLVKLSDYVKPDDKSLISCGFIFEAEGKSIFYPGDIGSRDDLYLFDKFKIDYIICECSHIDLHTIFAKYKQTGAERLFIIHISDEIEPELYQWHDSLDEKEKQNVLITGDGLAVEL